MNSRVYDITYLWSVINRYHYTSVSYISIESQVTITVIYSSLTHSDNTAMQKCLHSSTWAQVHEPLFEGTMTTIRCNTVILIVIIPLSLMCVYFVRLCGIDNWRHYYFLDNCASLAFLFISPLDEGG